MSVDYLLQNLLQAFLAYQEVNFQLQLISWNSTVHKSQILRKDLIKQEPSKSGLNISLKDGTILHLLLNTDFDL